MGKRVSFECTIQSGVIENVEFLLNSREIIRAHYFDKEKKFKALFEYKEDGEDVSLDMTEQMQRYLSSLSVVIDYSLTTVEDEISLDSGYIKKLLGETDSYLMIKLHLIIQSLLWRYIQNKIKVLPKQRDNWSFNQILDLADAFNEIPNRITLYLNSLNMLRNNIAHKPFAFEFSNIKRKYTAALYSKDGPLFGIGKMPMSDAEIYEDWKSTFLVAIIILGYVINNTHS
ncbi:hypothetical protein L4X63_23055 [Geomonas sp. Red32]|uniref:hypothetical protein n=1 Tax=Geomonas sp. Red32 TaxID=2912856 RepID=UPI00202CE74B|nr:hypothetical protein [Geomonas sp. Red32]MCM0084461.1 hypothetical protein [Geomonas sp. Red32]